MIWYILGILVIACGFIFLAIASQKTTNPFVGLGIIVLCLVGGLYIIFVPIRREYRAEVHMKNQLRSDTMLNITDYQTGGAVLIQCTANNATIVLNLLTTNVRGKEELLHFDEATAQYEEINIYTYKKWYPYDCGANS